ncbi:MAG TPA: hypothetical protein ENH82_20215 [bacterium]|nr:hypothetical protein [bacterium]
MAKIPINEEVFVTILEGLAKHANIMSKWERSFCQDILHVLDVAGVEGISLKQYNHIVGMKIKYSE